MSYGAQDWVRTLDIEMSSDRHILLELAFHLNDKTMACHPSLNTLAKEVRLSRNTVKACIERLIANGFLKAEPYFCNGTRAGTNYALVGYSCSNRVPMVEGGSMVDPGSMVGIGVGQSLTQGGSIVDPGVGQSLTPNKEDKQINKQVTKTSKDIAPKPKRQKQVFEKPDDISQELFDRIVQYRKDIQKPFKTQNGLDRIISQIRKAKDATGASYDEIVDFWTAKEWQGFEADWFIKTRQNTNSRFSEPRNVSHVTTVPKFTKQDHLTYEEADKIIRTKKMKRMAQQ